MRGRIWSFSAEWTDSGPRETAAHSSAPHPKGRSWTRFVLCEISVIETSGCITITDRRGAFGSQSHRNPGRLPYRRRPPSLGRYGRSFSSRRYNPFSSTPQPRQASEEISQRSNWESFLKVFNPLLIIFSPSRPWKRLRVARICW